MLILRPGISLTMLFELSYQTYLAVYLDTDVCILKFSQTIQIPEEDMESYVMRLKAMKFHFAIRLDQEMKLKITTGLTSKKARN